MPLTRQTTMSEAFVGAEGAPPPELVKVSDGIYAWVQPDGTWGLNNPGFFVGSDGVTVVDTCMTQARTEALVDAIRSVTDAPLRTLVNTHHHGDHTHGNYLLPAATVIAHEKCREEIVAAGLSMASKFPHVKFGELVVRPPFVTFTDRLTVFVDDRRVELFHPGVAHTTNDIVAWVPDQRILFSGDLLMNGGTPFMVAGSIAGSIAALDLLQALGAETIVPGHGAVCGPEVIYTTLGYLRLVRDLAHDMRASGGSPLETARAADLGEFAALSNSERLVGNLHRAAAELDGMPRGAPLDMSAIYAEMAEFNGGQLRSLA